MRVILKYKTYLYEVAIEAGTAAAHDNMPPEKMPPNTHKIKKRVRWLTDDMELRYKGTLRDSFPAFYPFLNGDGASYIPQFPFICQFSHI